MAYQRGADLQAVLDEHPDWRHDVDEYVGNTFIWVETEHLKRVWPWTTRLGIIHDDEVRIPELLEEILDTVIIDFVRYLETEDVDQSRG